MIATIGRFLCLTNPHRSRRALFMRAKQHNGNPSGRSGGQLPLHRGAKGAPAGGTVYFLNIECPFTGERQPPQAAAAAGSPCTGEPRGLLRGYSVFFEYRASFHGGTATPQAETAATPLAQGHQGGSCGGTAYFSNIGLPFTGERQPLRPQRRPAPLAQGRQGEYTPAIRYKKSVPGGEPLGTLFFALRQQLFGYCKNTSPHPRRR